MNYSGAPAYQILCGAGVLGQLFLEMFNINYFNLIDPVIYVEMTLKVSNHKKTCVLQWCTCILIVRLDRIDLVISSINCIPQSDL